MTTQPRASGMKVEAEDLEWGFVVPNESEDHDGSWTFVAVEGVTAAVQFCRVPVREEGKGAFHDVYVVTSEAASPAESARIVASFVARREVGAVVELRSESREYAAIHALAPIADGVAEELVGAAVAMTKATGTLDDADTFRLRFGALVMRATVTFGGTRWTCAVTRD